jgi:hypothetical protein
VSTTEWLILDESFGMVLQTATDSITVNCVCFWGNKAKKLFDFHSWIGLES